jgi:hypothetical protein
MDYLRNNFDVSYMHNNSMNFNILYMNIHSLRNKMSDLEVILENSTTQPEVVVICETWLSESLAPFCNLEGYEVVHNCRSDGYAGLSVFVRSNIEFELILNDKLNRNHFIMLNFGEQKFKLLAIYRDSAERMPTQFFEYIDKLIERNVNCLIVGDLNIDLYKDNETVNCYKDTLVSNNFCILNQMTDRSYTYYGPHGPSLIDHFASDMTTWVYNIERVPVAISDHCMFFISFSMETPLAVDVVCDTVDSVDLRKLRRTIPLEFGTGHIGDFAAFLVIFLRIIKGCTKRVPKRNRTRKRAPWICCEVLLAISFRDYWYKRHKAYPNCEFIERNFRRCKNNVTKIVRSCKKRYYSELISRSVGNSRKTWSVLNFLIYNREMKQRAKIKEIQDICHTGAMVKEESAICNVFNDFFVSIAENLRNELLRRNNFRQRLSTMRQWVSLTIMATATDFSELNGVLLGINIDSANGTDGIGARLLRCCGSELTEILVRVFNFHLMHGLFPSELKVARTVPIYKSGSHKLPTNYRPVSVLSNFAKIFEKLIHKRLSDFYDTIGFINRNQFGFVKNSSTSTAAINFVTSIRDSMNNRLYSSAIFIDISKAFDCVSHDILLEKLYKSGVRGKFYDLLESYLTGRTQVVNIGTSNSDRRDVKFGIPQGSVLGPLLFSVFINDIFELPLKGRLQLYADDAVLSYQHCHLDTMFADMQHDLDLISEWFFNNCLSVNASKTKYIIFGHPRTTSSIQGQLKLGFDIIERVTCIRYLGLLIDCRLNWEEHINHIRRKIVSFVGVLHKIKYLIPIRSRLQIFHAHVMSHILYMNAIWNTACEFRMKPLERLMNKAVRAVFYEEYESPMVHTVDLYRRHDLMTLKGLSKLETVTMVYKIKFNLIRHDIALTTNENVHQHDLRNNRNFHLDRFNNNYGKLSIRQHGADVYNKLPRECKDATGFNEFKRRVKKIILTECQM